MRVAYVSLVVGLCTVVMAVLSHPSAPTLTDLDADFAKTPATCPAEGTLYLQPIGCSGELWCIEGDREACPLPPGVEGEPSLDLHNGSRWFATVQGADHEADPDGAARASLICIRQDGFTVRLNTGPDLEPGPFTVRWPRHVGDGRISCIARRWAANGSVCEGGVYTLDLQFDEKGEIAGVVGAPRLAVRMDLVVNSGFEWGDGLVPDACGHDWSPDGRRLVLETMRQRLKVVDLQTGRQHLIFEQGSDPVWSPCNSTIAFKVVESFGAILTVCADGTEARSVVLASPRRWVICRPVFSPDGKSIAHARFVGSNRPSATWSDCTSTWVASLHHDPVRRRMLEASAGLVPVAWR